MQSADPVQWVHCFLSISCVVEGGAGTDCMVPFCSRRVSDKVLLNETFMSATRRSSLQELVDNGMDFILGSRRQQQASCTCSCCSAVPTWRVPYFLRDKQVPFLTKKY